MIIINDNNSYSYYSYYSYYQLIVKPGRQLHANQEYFQPLTLQSRGNKCLISAKQITMKQSRTTNGTVRNILTRTQTDPREKEKDYEMSKNSSLPS